MEKILFQDYPEHKRAVMLADNAVKVEDLGYMKPFTPEQIVDMQGTLSKRVIEIYDVEEEKKSITDGFKATLKPLNEEKNILLNNIRNKNEFVREACYKFIEHDEGKVGYYNSLGVLVEERPIRQDERQVSIFPIKPIVAKKTGTDN